MIGSEAAAGLAALLAGIATATLFRWRDRLPLASPNARTLHATPVPRVGGLAIWAAFIPVSLFAASIPAMSPALWLGPCAMLIAVSLRDDIRSVSILVRLGVQALASLWFAVALATSAALAPAAWAVLLIALSCAWSANLSNFMDGSDGLAATMALVGFSAYAGVLLWRGMPAALPMALAATMVPLLFVNRPPARMFLGDVGAVPLGFLGAAFGVGGVAGDAWPAWFPVLVFLPFVADATATLARRMIAGERFWQSHKSHYYQRLHRLGAGHGGTLAVWAALMLGSAGTAVACACLIPQWGAAALVAWCAVHAGVFAAIDYHWRKSAPSM